MSYSSNLDVVDVCHIACVSYYRVINAFSLPVCHITLVQFCSSASNTKSGSGSTGRLVLSAKVMGTALLNLPPPAD